MRRPAGLLAVVALVAVTGCPLRRSKPKPPPPVIAAPPTQPAPQSPPPISAPPKVDTPSTTEVPEPPASAAPQISVPVQPPPASRPRRAPPVRVPASPAESPSPAEASPPPAPPQFTQLLSPEEQAAHVAAIDAAVQRTEANLQLVATRRRNSNQRATEQRIRAFLAQVAQLRTTDLAAARSLAERASLLADDLVRSVR